MLLNYCSQLQSKGKRLVLASSSPRRQQLMSLLLPGVTFQAISSTFSEDLPHNLHTPHTYAVATALEKGKDVWSRAKGEVLISADTVVVRDDIILEKPQDAEHAFKMLKSLSGRSHQVVTGCVIIVADVNASSAATAASSAASSSSADSTSVIPGAIVETFSVSTEVTFAELSDEVIRAYIASNEPFDKAGGYGYQSLAATFVTRIDGDYYNVVGFPLHELAKRLAKHLDALVTTPSGAAKDEASQTSSAQ